MNKGPMSPQSEKGVPVRYAGGVRLYQRNERQDIWCLRGCAG